MRTKGHGVKRDLKIYLPLSRDTGRRNPGWVTGGVGGAARRAPRQDMETHGVNDLRVLIRVLQCFQYTPQVTVTCRCDFCYAGVSHIPECEIGKWEA